MSSIPSQCQPIADEILRLKEERADLQAELHTGLSSAQKADIVKQIKKLNNDIAAKEQELNECRFLWHLKHEMPTAKLILICDNARFHKAKWLTEWLAEQTPWLHLEFLPAYSPDFNPIERLWHWLKTEYTHNRCWVSKVDLKQTLQQMLRELPSRVNDLKEVIEAEIDRLKQAFDYYATLFPLSLQSLC
jgi:transposase